MTEISIARKKEFEFKLKLENFVLSVFISSERRLLLSLSLSRSLDDL